MSEEELNNESQIDESEITTVDDEPAEPAIVQRDGVYYYDKLFPDNHLGQFTESTALAYAMGWQDNFVAIENTEKGYNGWTYIKGYAPSKNLEQFKAEKLALISQKASSYSEYKCKEMYVVSSLGITIDADIRSQTNLRALIDLGSPCRFKDYFNDFHDLTVDDLKILLNECILNGFSLYNQKFTYEQIVKDATTDRELDFDIEFYMKDFS